MPDDGSGFGVWDYLVLSAMLVVSAAIGLYYRFSGGRQKTAGEYLLGDRNMSEYPVAFSLMASFMSAITLLGVCQENYTFGTQFVAINLAYVIGTPIVAYIYLPVFFRLQAVSAYEYLERRFGKAARTAASLAFSLQMILYMGVVLYAPALALSAVTGLSYFGSILAVGLVCTFYSTLGGMKAVLATDVFQSVLMFSAVAAAAIAGCINVDGGLAEVLKRAHEGNRLQFFNVDVDPSARHTLWTQIVGGIFIFVSIYGVNQAQVQRLLTTGHLRRSQRALWLHLPILALLSLSTSLAGLCIYAFYRDCDPVGDGRIRKGDQLLPLFVVDTMGHLPGLPGLFVAGIFSGSLSTVSSAINSLAAVTLEDYIKPFCKNSQVPHATLLLKCLAFVYGISSVGLTFLVEFLGPGVLQASLTIFGVVGGPLLGLFTLGMMTRRANQTGALIGLTTSLAFLFWIGFGQPKPPAVPLKLTTDNCTTGISHKNSSTLLAVSDSQKEQEEVEYFYLYRISYAWYAMIGFILTMTIGYLVSLVFARRQESDGTDLDPDVFFKKVGRRCDDVKSEPKKEEANLMAEGGTG